MNLHNPSEPGAKNPSKLKAWMNWSSLTRVRQAHVPYPTAESGRKFEAPDMCVFCTSEDLWMSAFCARKSLNSCCGNALGTFARLKTSRRSKLCPPKRPKNWKMARMFVGVLVGMLVAFGRPGSPCFTLVHPVGGTLHFTTLQDLSATESFF